MFGLSTWKESVRNYGIEYKLITTCLIVRPFLPYNLSQFNSIVTACVCVCPDIKNVFFLFSLYFVYFNATKHFQVNKRNIISFDGFTESKYYTHRIYMRIGTVWQYIWMDRIAFSKAIFMCYYSNILNSKRKLDKNAPISIAHKLHIDHKHTVALNRDNNFIFKFICLCTNKMSITVC